MFNVTKSLRSARTMKTFARQQQRCVASFTNASIKQATASFEQQARNNRYYNTYSSSSQSKSSSKRNKSVVFGGVASAMAIGLFASKDKNEKETQFDNASTSSKTVVRCDSINDNDLKPEESEFNIFTPRVMNVWYRLVLVAVSLASGGILYLLLSPVLAYNHLEDSVQHMRVGNKRVRWDGEFGEYYKQCMINLALTVGTLGFYQILGYADLRLESYVDKHMHLF